MGKEQIFGLFLLPLFNLILWVFLKKRSTYLYLIPGLTFFAFFSFQLFDLQKPEIWQIKNWLNIGPLFSGDLALNLSSKTLTIACLNIFITIIIQVYSFAYLSKKDNFGLYNTLISMFSAAMAWLLLAGNLFTLFLGWEWLGLVSYLLVQFWYQTEKPIQSGLRVLLINKLGDIALLSGLGLLVSYGLGSSVFQQTGFPTGAEVFFHSTTGNILCLFLVLGAMVKSAQFPFNLWLKEAMQGPTSVSALLHSATMVVAGVWLLLQISPVFGPEIQWFLILTGGCTLLISNAMAILSQHLKNTLAFSTMAQLGIMVLGIGLGKNDEATFHLVSHAFFKSSLFLICGILIQQTSKLGFAGLEAQFLPNMKGLLKNQLVLKIPLLCCLVALAGWPLTSGFISKESIMPHVFGGENSANYWFGFVFLQLGILGTAFYTTRFAIQICFGNSPQQKGNEKTSFFFLIPVWILSLGSGFWLFGFNPLSAQGWLSSLLELNGHFVFPDVVALSLGTFLGWYFWEKKVLSFIQRPNQLITNIVEMRQQVFVFQLSWKFLTKAGLWANSIDKKAIDFALDSSSKIFVIGGHFTNFADRKIVDGLVSGLVGVTRFIGFQFWNQTRKSPQSVGFIAILTFFLIILFSNH